MRRLEGPTLTATGIVDGCGALAAPWSGTDRRLRCGLCYGRLCLGALSAPWQGWTLKPSCLTGYQDITQQKGETQGVTQSAVWHVCMHVQQSACSTCRHLLPSAVLWSNPNGEWGLSAKGFAPSWQPPSRRVWCSRSTMARDRQG
jgi:hypothetical protein